jgi:hypothetical protein
MIKKHFFFDAFVSLFDSNSHDAIMTLENNAKETKHHKRETF